MDMAHTEEEAWKPVGKVDRLPFLQRPNSLFSNVVWGEGGFLGDSETIPRKSPKTPSSILISERIRGFCSPLRMVEFRTPNAERQMSREHDF